MGNVLGSPRPCRECFRKSTTNRRKQRLIRLEDVLIFFNRSHLERISLSSRQLRHIVVNYFYESPYLFLYNSCVTIIHKSFALLKFRGTHYGVYFDQHTLTWIGIQDDSNWPQIEQDILINIKDLYFPKWFRVDLAQIECSIFAEKSVEDAMAAYESICHIWTGQTLRIFSRTTHQDDIMNLRVRLAIDMLLNNSDLLRVRELQYRAWDYVQQISNYPLVYGANIVRVERSHRWNAQHMVDLIEGKVLHPESPTIFVINALHGHFSENFRDLYRILRFNFDHATTPRSYVVVILRAWWPNSGSRGNHANEIWLCRNGGGEKYFHNYDEKWNYGDTCRLDRFSKSSRVYFDLFS